jgi:hypothetical protein
MFGPPKVQLVLVLSSFFVGLSFLTVITRLCARSMIVRIIGVEDYLIIGSMVCPFWERLR